MCTMNVAQVSPLGNEYASNMVDADDADNTDGTSRTANVLILRKDIIDSSHR